MLQWLKILDIPPGIATSFSWIFYFKALQIGKVAQVAPANKLRVALTIYP
jgi:transporter family protein